MQIVFTKMHGLGNDFVVIDTFTQAFTPITEIIQQWADRNFGIGFDQLLLLQPPLDENNDVHYRIFNADGGEVMQCGNGARCAAIYLQYKGLVNKECILAETGAGLLQLNVKDDVVTVDMGQVKLLPTEIPAKFDQQQMIYQIDIADRTIDVGLINIGNPHAVVLVDDINHADVDEIGAALQSLDIFPESINVGFMQVLNKQECSLRVYERGAGETLACGSGACAGVVYGYLRGVLESQVKVHLTGGELDIHYMEQETRVIMNGEATIVFEGEIKYDG